MGSINLYKIEKEKNSLFLQELEKMDFKGKFDLPKDIENPEKGKYVFSLYLSVSKSNKDVPWNWVLNEFNKPCIEISTTAKAILIVESETKMTYAITFGYSYFLVDKYCDRNFGFDFARKLNFQEIKTTTLTSPNSHRNKTINTYVNYNDLEFDSGESFAKIKAKVVLEEDFSLFKPILEIGSSIRFSTSNNSLQQIMNLIIYIENILKNENDKSRFPVFSKVSDNTKKATLEKNLMSAIKRNSTQMNISELDIIGVTEIFNRNDGEFLLKFRGKRKKICTLSKSAIETFCNEYSFDFCQSFLDINVISLYNGETIATKKIRDSIDFTDDQEKCLLSKGVWYQYNDDYLSYLRDSIAEIDVKYYPEYDFNSKLHSDFIEQKLLEVKDNPEYAEKSIDQIKKELTRKYYAERAFNEIRGHENGFKLFDRNIQMIENTKIEIMDLYKNDTMYAVKIGNTSSKLCYVVDQSLTSIKASKTSKIFGDLKITTVVIWLVLENHGHIENDEGIPQLSNLNMLMLMNRLDEWKKEVRLQGYKPLIYINYRTV